MASTQQFEWIETDIPARMDRLPWSRWHWLVVVALGITWVLDGLQVTLGGAIGATLQNSQALGLTPAQVGMGASCYLAGGVLGALGFGYSTDRFGRKKLFYITLIVYLTAVALTAFAWNFASYAFFLALTGAGIGGEYAAINSAIDELIPARVRGRVDLIVNSTYWLGSALGAGATLILLNPQYFPIWLGWRVAFGIGALLGLIVLYFRHWVPESPRWLMIHGHYEEAEKIVKQIEDDIAAKTGQPLPEITEDKIRIRQRGATPLKEIWNSIAHEHRMRSFLALALMTAQAFFYNAIFFTYGLVLVQFYGVPPQSVSGYILPFALGNLLGPVLLGHLFDTIGRKPMIVGTYALSGILLALTAFLFRAGVLNADTQSWCWTIIFFIASAAASAAYLTVSEIFPLEIRGLAIALFYATGTLVGGVFAPWIFASLIQTGSRATLSWGYFAGAILMIGAAIVEAYIGVAAERKSLESITAPLASRE
ncbi:MAG: MFS transporter [Candidatus Obscuribacterales bacterium]|nr:MFS transporter [Candidatus Obscuribacterales bacterium]